MCDLSKIISYWMGLAHRLIWSNIASFLKVDVIHVFSVDERE